MQTKMICWDGNISKCDDISVFAIGTSAQGGISCGYSQLVAAFGEPSAGDGDKIQAEWFIATPAGIATIYDWKEGDCYHGIGYGTSVKQVTKWSIGGHHNQVVEWIQKAIKATT